MRREAEKLYNGITCIDDELVVEYDDSTAKRSPDHESEFFRKRFQILTLASAIIILVVAGFMLGRNIPVKTEGNPDIKMGGNTEITIGTREGDKPISLNAEEIANTPIDTSQLEKLKSLMKQVDYSQIANDIERLIEDGTEGFLLTDTNNLCISKQNLYMIDLSGASVANIAYEFIFSDDNVVGYIMFFAAGGKLEYSISLNTPYTTGYYFDFLNDNQDMSFVVLTDGFSGYFLGENNSVYNARTGKVTDDFPVTGDCYQALNVNEMDISYQKIMEQITTIQEGENRNG